MMFNDAQLLLAELLSTKWHECGCHNSLKSCNRWGQIQVTFSCRKKGTFPYPWKQNQNLVLTKISASSMVKCWTLLSVTWWYPDNNNNNNNNFIIYPQLSTNARGPNKCLKEIIKIEHNRVYESQLAIYNHGWGLNSGLPWTNPASSQSKTWTQGLRIASPAL